MTYHEKKDILYVKQLLEHRELKNTFIYTHLMDFEDDDSYDIKVASDIDEFTSLLESEFEYITDYDKVLRKRK